MKKLLLLLFFLPMLAFGQLDEGEYFTGQFRPNKQCIYEYEGFTNFKVWKCILPGEQLPVNLLSFHGKEIRPSWIQVVWSYNEAIDHAGFILEHSTDAKEFRILKQTTGSGFLHQTTSPLNYYRLKSIDMNGTVHVYQIIHVISRQPAKGGRMYDIFGRPLYVAPKNQVFIQDGKKIIIVDQL